MEPGDYIVKDSSVWKDIQSVMRADYSIRIGVVREHVFLEDSADTRYIVEVWKNQRLFPMTCTRTSRFGGVYNFEEFTHTGFSPGSDNASLGNFSVVPGDMVIVAAAKGNAREGFILGSLNHFARDQIIPADGEQAYVSEFNGMQTVVNKFGEQRVMFKGVPTNVSELAKSPTGEPIPPPEYDTSVGGTYTLFDRNGSYTLTDNAAEDPQSIHMNKPDGQVVITSGNTSLVIDKENEQYYFTNKITVFDSTDSWSLNTKATNIQSNDIDIQATNIKTSGEWEMSGNMEIAGNIKQTGNNEISGNIKATGTAQFGSAPVPMVKDIILTIGTGNLGVPVISSNILLKTVTTKGT